MKHFKHYLLLAVVFVAFGISANAQQTGVKGVVLDLETLKPLSGVSVQISNSNQGTTTNDNGEFFIALPKNSTKEYRLVGNLIGYSSDSTTFSVTEDVPTMVSLSLLGEKAVLDAVVITRRRERASEIALLDMRKKSNLMVEAIGAQELSRKGVSDADAALTKMSGVTKSGSGANVFVRGLGDRYNSTSLNGLPLPSEDPLNKNISLDFFGTSVIDNINVNKTFNSSLSGDVAGANVDIISKELSGGDFFEIGASAGINSQAIQTEDFKKIDGTNWFGSLKETKSPVTSLTEYQFGNGWNTGSIKRPLNSSFSLAGGKRFRVGENNLNLFVTANMNSEYRHFDGVVRQTNTAGALITDQTMVRSQYNVSKTAMANLKYSFGNNYISINSMYIGDQSQDFSENFGRNIAEEDGDLRLWRRQHVVDNHLFVNQLLSRLQLADNWSLDLGAGFNVVSANEPDRRTTNLLYRDSTILFYNNAGGADNERYYSEISERGWALKAISSYKFENVNDYDRKVEFGYNGNLTKRDFEARLFWHNTMGGNPINGREYDIDGLLNGSALNNGGFELRTNFGGSLDPNYYRATRNIHSALASGTYQFNERLTAVLGLRYDRIDQDIDYRLQTNSSNVQPAIIKKDFFLPSLNVKYSVNENSNLRAAASQSYTLPQFIELAPFQNTFATFRSEGNARLIPVESINFDLKWELFPTSGELISVGAFYKRLKNPIARVETINNLMNYFNIGSSAQIAGVEVEFKKNLLRSMNSYGENILSAGANVSYLYSKQDLQSSQIQFGENTSSALQGASPLLVNADISYLYQGNNWRLTSSVVGNYFSDRIFMIGAVGFKNVIEKGVPTLDFIANADIGKRWGISIKARNLLNPKINLERETDFGDHIILESFKRGIDASAGVSYRF